MSINGVFKDYPFEGNNTAELMRKNPKSIVGVYTKAASVEMILEDLEAFGD